MDKGQESIKHLAAIMDRLLSPEGCPWDREQTHETLLRYLIEEAYEVVEAVKERDMLKLKEELGDVLLQVVFHAALAERAGFFTLDDVAGSVSDKMIARHPHVFGSLDLKTSSDVLQHWEGFKKKEGKKTVLSGIPVMMPALLRALKIQEKAARVGFDWPAVDGAIEKFAEEVAELKQASSQEQIQEEVGDLIFALVNVARMKGIDPEEALQGCNDKFTRRFNYIEERLIQYGRVMGEVDLKDLDLLWDEAKDKGY